MWLVFIDQLGSFLSGFLFSFFSFCFLQKTKVINYKQSGCHLSKARNHLSNHVFILRLTYQLNDGIFLLLHTYYFFSSSFFRKGVFFFSFLFLKNYQNSLSTIQSSIFAVQYTHTHALDGQHYCKFPTKSVLNL